MLLCVHASAPDLGWTDGRNVRIDLRWGGDDTNRIQAVAQELVRLQPDIILTAGVLPTAAVRRETRTIPIVFAALSDPVVSGLVARLDRPSGNNLRNDRQSRTLRDIFSPKASVFA